MSVSISELRGITPEILEGLNKKGLKDSDDLLEAVKTPKQRRELASELNADTRALLELGNRADLARINGIGAVFSDLLEYAGVDTVKELAMRRADNLHAKMAEVNEEKNLAQRLPTQDDVEAWVAAAKDLPKVLEY